MSVDMLWRLVNATVFQSELKHTLNTHEVDSLHALLLSEALITNLTHMHQPLASADSPDVELISVIRIKKKGEV